MTDKKTTKTEKQAVEKPPIDLSDEQLDKAESGSSTHLSSITYVEKKCKDNQSE